ncbi:hypothetical protein B7463_g7399, partial [Scytalidium lignicola]
MAIKKAMEEISKIRAKRQVQDVINMYNGLDETQARTEAGKGYTSLSTVVKPYLIPMEGIDGIELLELELGTTADEEHQEEPNESTIAVVPPPVLLGVFEIVDPQSVLNDICIFNARFVDEIKNKGIEKAFEKSCLVVQAYKDDGKKLVLTQSPTIQRVSQCIILCIAAMEYKSTSLYLQDISQVYVQSTTLLNRDFYVWPPLELIEQLGLRKGSILRVVKPFYGVLEVGNHWF